MEPIRSSDSRILIVEDDPDLVSFLHRAAERVDPALRIDSAADAEGARDALERRHYDGVLADYSIEGDGNGWELRGLVADTQGDAWFAVMSAMPRRPTDDVPYLQKPFSLRRAEHFLRGMIEQDDT